jgi:hypothetical protein
VKLAGGYILLARKIIESEIWQKPPLYLKVWVYLLTRAQHSTFKGLDKGQLMTSIPEIQDACTWYVGCRKVMPTKDQIFQVLEWLRQPRCVGNAESNAKATMIATSKATHQMLVTINNYGIYQDPKHYESNAENNGVAPTKATRVPDNINKNDIRMNKNDINLSTTLPNGNSVDKYGTGNAELIVAIDGFIEMRKKIRKPLTDRALKLMLNDLAKIGSTDEMKIAILNQSTMNSWLGVFPLKDSGTRPKDQQQAGRSVLERIARGESYDQGASGAIIDVDCHRIPEDD